MTTTSEIVLYICACLHLSGGAILGSVSIWGMTRLSYFFWLPDLSVQLSTMVFMVAGSMLCLPTCWLSTLVPYHTRSSTIPVVLICVVTGTLVVLSAGLLSTAVLANTVRDVGSMNSSLLAAMDFETPDGNRHTSNLFTYMQNNLQCCGVNSYRDWYAYRSSLPSSCCAHLANDKRIIEMVSCEVPTYTIGCLQPALSALRNFTTSVALSASLVIITMAANLFTTAYVIATRLSDRFQYRKESGTPKFRVSCLAPYVVSSTPAVLPHSALMPTAAA